MTEESTLHNQEQYKIVITRIRKSPVDIAIKIANDYGLDVNRIKILIKNLPYEIPQKFNTLKTTKKVSEEFIQLGCDTKFVKLNSEAVDNDSPPVKTKREKKLKDEKPSRSNDFLVQKVLIVGLVLLIPVIWMLISMLSSSTKSSEAILESKAKKEGTLSPSDKSAGAGKSSKNTGSSQRGGASDSVKVLATKENRQASDNKASTSNQASNSVGHIADNKAGNKAGNNKSSEAQNTPGHYNSKQGGEFTEEPNTSLNSSESNTIDKQSVLKLDEIADLLTPMQNEVLNSLDLEQPLKLIMDDIDNSPLSRRERIEIANIYQESIENSVRKTVAMLEVSIAFNKYKKKTWRRLIQAYQTLGEMDKANLATEQVQKIFPENSDQGSKSRNSDQDSKPRINNENRAYSYQLNSSQFEE